LRAIEEEHFDQLPGGIFNKGFVRAYARQVGVNEDEAVAAYLEASGESVVKVEPGEASFPLQIPREKRKPASTTAAEIPWSLLGLALIVLAVAFATWHSYTTRNTAPAGVRAAAELPATAQKPAPELVPTSERSSAAAGVASTMPPAGVFTVRIEAREQCWVSLKADGKPDAEETLAAGAQRSITGTRQIELKAGNVGALSISFNGQKLPSQGDYGEVKLLSFGPDGLEVTTKIPASSGANP